ncbi:MAG: SCO family protein [Oligoflexales bacterium]|nr:SCO family protein [Oligoflexales bacterium]
MKLGKLTTLLLAFMLFSSELVAKKLAKDSIYQLGISWTSQNGTLTPLEHYQGKMVILAMTYTSCEYSCPLTVKKLQSIEKDLRAKKFDNYQIIIASLDPENDKPEVLKAYMKKNNLSEKNWTFLTAKNDAEVRKLAVLLEVQYQKTEGKDFSHSNAMTMLDSEGRIAYKLAGVSSNHSELIKKVSSFK